MVNMNQYENYAANFEMAKMTCLDFTENKNYDFVKGTQFFPESSTRNEQYMNHIFNS